MALFQLLINSVYLLLLRSSIQLQYTVLVGDVIPSDLWKNLVKWLNSKINLFRILYGYGRNNEWIEDKKSKFFIWKLIKHKIITLYVATLRLEALAASQLISLGGIKRFPSDIIWWFHYAKWYDNSLI